MAEAKRKHRATGKKPPGGARQGAGRPKGGTNAMEYGEVAAIAATKLRPPPPDAPPEVHKLAARALQRIVHVMEEGVWYQNGRNVLAAATRVREEACGLLTQKVEHKVELESLTDEQLEAKHKALLDRIAAQKPSGELEG